MRKLSDFVANEQIRSGLIHAAYGGAKTGKPSGAGGKNHTPRRSRVTAREKQELETKAGLKAGGPGSGRHSEGVVKNDDSPKSRVICEGPNCSKEKVSLNNKDADGKKVAISIPHLDNVELMMTSNKADQHIHFDKEALKAVLRMALVQLDAEDHEIRYLNTPQGTSTDHFTTVKFRQKGSLTSSARRDK